MSFCHFKINISLVYFQVSEVFSNSPPFPPKIHFDIADAVSNQTCLIESTKDDSVSIAHVTNWPFNIKFSDWSNEKTLSASRCE